MTIDRILYYCTAAMFHSLLLTQLFAVGVAFDATGPPTVAKNAGALVLRGCLHMKRWFWRLPCWRSFWTPRREFLWRCHAGFLLLLSGPLSHLLNDILCCSSSSACRQNKSETCHRCHVCSSSTSTVLILVNHPCSCARVFEPPKAPSPPNHGVFTRFSASIFHSSSLTGFPTVQK